ncbi:hypothetical protein MMC16_000384 [Acarospora aff. strigata]|nr:hypothetical protein [Acarospora aff. strigata]
MDAREENATVQYMKWTDLYLKEKPFQMFLDLPPDAADQRKTNVVFEPKEIVVQNIRGREADLDLDHQGFIVRRLTEIPDLKDLDTTIVESVYLPAMEKLLRAEVEGVDRVFFFDWRLRSSSVPTADVTVNLKDLSAKLGPANIVHVDQAPVASLNRVRKHLAKEADHLLEGRVRIINLWRPIKNPVEDWPLAICDGSTIDMEDLIETDTVRRDYIGSNMFALHRETQAWYYLHKQQADEVLIFKQFDSHPDVEARCMLLEWERTRVLLKIR